MLALIKQFVGGMFSKDLGIDLGTCNTVVYVRGEGIVFQEPSVVAVRKDSNEIIMNGRAVGKVAKQMLGKTSDKIVIVRPLKNGVVTDFDVTSSMIQYFIKKVHPHSFGVMPRVVIAVPSGITKIEKKAVVNAAEAAGARRVFLIDEPMASAIGAGLPILESVASMIVDIGGGTTEIAIISCGVVNGSKSIKVAGDALDQAIMEFLKDVYNIQIGPQTAEKIKIQIGTVWEIEHREMIVRGRDVLTGMPREITLSSEDVCEALKKPLSEIITGIKSVIDNALPEITADLMEQGITISGGGALMRGIKEAVHNEIKIPVKIAQEPLHCVAKGTGTIIEDLDKFKVTLESEEDVN
ncbi:MAG: rod shape-determining protein [Planctomycetes bacterium]|nr:rod shape-determining protein [Planctomycetota bacterium]